MLNKEQTKKAVVVMEAWGNGAECEFRMVIPPVGKWKSMDTLDQPLWNWGLYEYRVKPQRVEVRAWAVVCCGEKLRTYDTENEATSRRDYLAGCGGHNVIVVPLTGTYTEE